MEYRHLGKAGLKVSALSFGSWLTFGAALDQSGVRQCMRTAFDHGINTFDTAEEYGDGLAEFLMGTAFKDFRREDLVVSTKLFWGGKGINDTGLSWKHLVEGAKQSLKRLGLDYVDVLLCHRPDPLTPIEETVRAIDVLIKQGLVFYWGTSEWKASEIEAAYEIAYGIGATPPSVEQPMYNLFHRARVEKEYAPICQKYGMGLMAFSPLDSGILTGKYNEGIPDQSRLHLYQGLRHRLNREKVEKVKQLARVAEDLKCSLAQLALAWCLKNEAVSTVILGASHPQQIEENVMALHVLNQLDDALIKQIEAITG